MTRSARVAASRPVTRFALTEPERLGLLFTTVRGLPTDGTDHLVVFRSSPLALSDAWDAPDQLPGLLDPVTVTAEVGGRSKQVVDSLVWAVRPGARLTRGQRRQLTNGGVDHVVSRTHDGRVEAIDVRGTWTRSREGHQTRAVLARALGPSLAILLGRLLPAGSQIPVGLAGADKPGWVAVPLGLACPTCGQRLIRVDHHYPGRGWDSPRQAVVCLSGQQHPRTGNSEAMSMAHRQLTASVPERPELDEERAERNVYVIESSSVADGSIAFYVGQTAIPPEQRLEQHRTGVKAAQAFRSGRYLPGRLRPDLLPELPSLLADETSRAAEQFTYHALAWAGLPVLGGT